MKRPLYATKKPPALTLTGSATATATAAAAATTTAVASCSVPASVAPPARVPEVVRVGAEVQTDAPPVAEMCDAGTQVTRMSPRFDAAPSCSSVRLHVTVVDPEGVALAVVPATTDVGAKVCTALAPVCASLSRGHVSCSTRHRS